MRHGIYLFFILFAILTPIPAKSADVTTNVIMLDPGHGGHDTGYKGIGGTFEKQVTLQLAKEIARKVMPFAQVYLTRSDDYSVDIFERTGMANYRKANLFISLHAGGSFNPHSDNVICYTTTSLESQSAHFQTNLWHTAQQQHLGKSHSLASHIRFHLIKSHYVRDVSIGEAPLLVLNGANMPAVLIETGWLSDTDRENQFHNRGKRDVFVAAMVHAIRAMLRSETIRLSD